MKKLKQLIFIFIRNFLDKKNYTINKFTEKDKIINFFKLIKPLSIEGGLVRIGSKNDGGYLVPACLEDIKYNFSPGVSNDFNFEIDLYKKYSIRSHLADYSIEDNFDEYEYITFEKKYLGIQNTETTLCLKDWIKKYNSNYEKMMLSMDIENNEWEVLIDISNSLLSKFKILVIEFHNFGNYLLNKNSFNFVESVFTKLKNSFEIVHIHPNNCCEVIKYDDLEIPNVVEISFINKVDFVYSNRNISIPHRLDSKNIISKEEIVLQKIWDLAE